MSRKARCDLADVQHPDFPFDGLERVALQEFMFRRTLPMFGTRGGRDVIAGTGSLLSVGKLIFVVTASHVLDSIDHGSLAIPDGRLQAAVWPLREGTIFRLRSTTGDADFDVAVVHVRDDASIQRLRGAWGCLELSNIGRVPPPGTACLISGFPEELSAVTLEEQTGGYVMFATKIVAEPPRNAESPVHPEVDIFLEMGARGQDLRTGNVEEPPRLPGVSGASVWAYSPPGKEDVWSVESCLKVIGIQSGARHKSYIRAKSWQPIYEALKRMKFAR